LSDIWHITHFEITVRLLLSALLGGLIGLEREWNNHAAGLRTHILVCIGSTAIMLLSIYGFSEFVTVANVRTDPARLAAQVITGIGFLGAGAIMRTGSSVSGLTTAASIWVVAAIGLCVGAGFFYVAFLSTVLVFLILFVLNKVERLLMWHRRRHEIVIKILDQPQVLGRIATKFGEQGIQIVSLQMIPVDSSHEKEPMISLMELRFSIKAKNQEKLLLALDGISKMDDFISMESDHWNQSKAQKFKNQIFSNSLDE
jgi:putative Mg2+ transporter-C (MgtC) family protein